MGPVEKLHLSVGVNPVPRLQISVRRPSSQPSKSAGSTTLAARSSDRRSGAARPISPASQPQRDGLPQVHGVVVDHGAGLQSRDQLSSGEPGALLSSGWRAASPSTPSTQGNSRAWCGSDAARSAGALWVNADAHRS